MTEKQFWYGETRLLYAYAKAYQRHISYTAWFNGYYGYIGTSVCLSNVFASKNSKPHSYPQWEDITKQHETKQVNVTKENIEEVFRNQQIQQNNWLRQLINKE